MRLIFLFTLCLWAIKGYAQHDFSYYFKESKALPRTDANRTYSLLYNDSTGYYVLRFDKYQTQAELHHYDTLLQHRGSYDITDKPRKYVGIISIQDKMYLIYFQYIENKIDNVYEKVSLYAKTIHPTTFQMSRDSIELIPPFRMESNYYRGNFAISPDRSKVLIYDYEEDGDISGVPGLTNKITMRVFDTRLKLLWMRTVDLSPTEQTQRVVAIKKLRINNEGEVAILTDVFRKERAYDLKHVTADPTLYFVGKEPQNFARFTPNLGEYFFNQLDFSFDQEGNVLWFGFYSKQKYYQQSGAFFLKINAERTKVLVKKVHEFDEEFMREITNKLKTKIAPEPANFKLVHWRRNPGGGITLTAEHQPYSPASFKSNGIIAMELNANGEVVWKKYIYKLASQSKKMEPFLSHFLLLDDNNAYILYNEGIYSDGFSRVYQIDSTGKLRRRVVMTYDAHLEVVCPTLSASLGEGRVFVCMQDRFFQSHRVGVLNVRKLFER